MRRLVVFRLHGSAAGFMLATADTVMANGHPVVQFVSFEESHQPGLS